MRASDYIEQLPEQAGPERERKILEWAIKGQLRPIEWAQVRSGRAVFQVSADGLKVGDENDSVRLNACHATAQQLADILGVRLPTTKIEDLAWAQAPLRIKPQIQTPDAAMSNTSRMVQHSRAIDAIQASIQSMPESQKQFLRTAGKVWALTNRLEGNPGRAANYGWHDRGAPNGKCWQPLGLAHNLRHVDYSQNLFFVHPLVDIEGVNYGYEEVLTTPAFAQYASDEGVLRITRHPGVSPDHGDILHTLLPPPLLGCEGPAEDPGVIPFVQAFHYRKADRKDVRVLVVHDTETPQTVTSAEVIAATFASKASPMASPTYAVDVDSCVQMVRDEDVAFHVGAPANDWSVGIEHAGYARYSAEDWGSIYSRAMLRRSAGLAARICRKWGIPPVFLTAAQLRDPSARGITTHKQISDAFHGSNHWDPGPGFPILWYVNAVACALAA
jgi:N-acetyl-anhydromuramyl-L-alanine amidase AmpD